MGYSSAVIKNFDCNIQTNCKNKIGKSGLATLGAIPFSYFSMEPIILTLGEQSQKLSPFTLCQTKIPVFLIPLNLAL